MPKATLARRYANDGEQFWPDQSRRLYDALDCPKQLVRCTAAEGADSHCEPKAPILRNQRVLDWLDETYVLRAAHPVPSRSRLRVSMRIDAVVDHENAPAGELSAPRPLPP